jgi:hypothetical protein
MIEKTVLNALTGDSAAVNDGDYLRVTVNAHWGLTSYTSRCSAAGIVIGRPSYDS